MDSQRIPRSSLKDTKSAKRARKEKRYSDAGQDEDTSYIPGVC